MAHTRNKTWKSFCNSNKSFIYKVSLHSTLLLNNITYNHLNNTHTFTPKNICNMAFPSSIWLPRAPGSVWTLTLSHSSGSEGGRGVGLYMKEVMGSSLLGQKSQLWRVSAGQGGSQGQPHTLPLSISRLLLFHSSIHFSFQITRKNRKEQWPSSAPNIIPTAGMHTEKGPLRAKGLFSLLSLFSPCLHAFTSTWNSPPCLCSAYPHSLHDNLILFPPFMIWNKLPSVFPS